MYLGGNRDYCVKSRRGFDSVELDATEVWMYHSMDLQDPQASARLRPRGAAIYFDRDGSDGMT